MLGLLKQAAMPLCGLFSAPSTQNSAPESDFPKMSSPRRQTPWPKELTEVIWQRHFLPALSDNDIQGQWTAIQRLQGKMQFLSPTQQHMLVDAACALPLTLHDAQRHEMAARMVEQLAPDFPVMGPDALRAVFRYGLEQPDSHARATALEYLAAAFPFFAEDERDALIDAAPRFLLGAHVARIVAALGPSLPEMSAEQRDKIWQTGMKLPDARDRSVVIKGLAHGIACLEPKRREQLINMACGFYRNEELAGPLASLAAQAQHLSEDQMSRLQGIAAQITPATPDLYQQVQDGFARGAAAIRAAEAEAQARPKKRAAARRHPPLQIEQIPVYHVHPARPAAPRRTPRPNAPPTPQLDRLPAHT